MPRKLGTFGEIGDLMPDDNRVIADNLRILITYPLL